MTLENLLNAKEFKYLESICQQYNIAYNEELIDQILDKYYHAKKLQNVSKEQAVYLVFNNFLENVKEQYKKRYNND